MKKKINYPFFKKEYKKRKIDINVEKTILVVKVYANFEELKPEYDWEFPHTIPTSKMIGVLELIKADLIENWREISGAYKK